MLFTRLFHHETPAAEESALAPQVSLLPPTLDPVRAMHSRHAKMRLRAVNSIAEKRNAYPKEILALVNATQDKNHDVEERASEALISLSRSGQEEEVVRAFVQAIHRQPHIVEKIVPTGYYFKIPDRAEEKRMEDEVKSN